MNNQKYWQKREQKWIKSALYQDSQFEKELTKYYQQALEEINSQIDSFYLKYANSQGISYSDAMKAVQSADIAKLSKEAKRIVRTKDFSDYANAQMKLYNATMAINRLEYLKSQIGFTLVKHGNKIEKSLRKHLTTAYQDEIKRQEGIFKDFNISPTQMQSDAESIVNASFHNATWSERLWSSMSGLQAQLGIDVTNIMTQGLDMRALEKHIKPLIKDDVKNTTYVAHRLAKTETARVQFQAELNQLHRYDIKRVAWIAEPSACSICKAIEAKNKGLYPIDEVPEIPVHPNCRCTIAGDARQELEDYFNSRN